MWEKTVVRSACKVKGSTIHIVFYVPNFINNEIWKSSADGNAGDKGFQESNIIVLQKKVSLDEHPLHLWMCVKDTGMKFVDQVMMVMQDSWKTLHRKKLLKLGRDIWLVHYSLLCRWKIFKDREEKILQTTKVIMNIKKVIK